MRVRDWMSPDPVTVSPTAHLTEARELLERYGVHHIPVVDHDRVVGMISDRDIRLSRAVLQRAVGRLVREGGPPRTLEEVGEGLVVAMVMSSPVHAVDANQDLDTAIRSMLTHRISALPVLDDGRLVGLLTTTDCLLASLAPPAQEHPGRELAPL